MAEKEKYILAMGDSRVTIYLAFAVDEKELIRTARQKYRHVTIAKLKPSASQSQNPFGGLYLEHVEYLLPIDDFNMKLDSLCLALEGFSPEEMNNLINDAADRLNVSRLRYANLFTEDSKITEEITIADPVPSPGLPKDHGEVAETGEGVRDGSSS